jgi:hypothetical protein
MIVTTLAALLLGQLHAWLSLWAGFPLPDPYPVLVGFVGLNARRADLPWTLLLLAWARALALAEPLGGHLLATGAAVLLLSAQRNTLDGRRAGALVVATLLAALTLVLSGWLLRAASGAPLSAGWPLLLGAALVLPLLVPLRAAAARTRRRTA